MKNVQAIIDLFGGLDKLQASYISLENEPWMRLVIERIGDGPRGLPAVSVAHYYTQNGDAMRDPEMVFEIDSAGGWHPIMYQNDGVGVYQEAVFLGQGPAAGKILVRPRLVKDLAAFARMWDRNIVEQGFVEAARVAAGTKQAG